MTAPGRSAFDWLVAFWNRPTCSYRSRLATRIFLLLLGSDLCINTLPHAARYGLSRFDVPHFAWLESLRLESETYLCATVIGATFAFYGAFRGPTPGVLLLILLTQAFGWSASLMDSFQHHYFISLALLCLVFSVSARRRSPPVPTGWRMLGLTCALLYAYAALNKLEPGWRDGAVVADLLGPKLAAFQNLLHLPASLHAALPRILSVGIVATELLLAAAYLLASVLDAPRRLRLRPFLSLAFVLAVSLHLGIELANVKIRFFSAYMILLACAFFLPLRALMILARPALAARKVIRRWRARSSEASKNSAESIVHGAGAAALTIALLTLGIHMPGVGFTATAPMVAVILYSVARTIRRARAREALTSAHAAGGGGPAPGRVFVVAALAVVLTARFSGARREYLTVRVDDLVRAGRTGDAIALRTRYLSQPPP